VNGKRRKLNRILVDWAAGTPSRSSRSAISQQIAALSKAPS